MKFSENLRNLRKEKDYSQEYLAEVMKVSRQTISKWENGMAMPDLKKLTELAELFGVGMNELLGIENDGEAPVYTNENSFSTEEYVEHTQRVLTAITQNQNKIYQKNTRTVTIIFVVFAVVISIILLSNIANLSARVATLENNFNSLRQNTTAIDYDMDTLTADDYVTSEILKVYPETPYIIRCRMQYMPEEYKNGESVYFLALKTDGETEKYEATEKDGVFTAEEDINLIENHDATYYVCTSDGENITKSEINPSLEYEYLGIYGEFSLDIRYNSFGKWTISCEGSQPTWESKVVNITNAKLIGVSDNGTFLNKDLKILTNEKNTNEHYVIIDDFSFETKTGNDITFYLELTDENGVIFRLKSDSVGTAYTEEYEIIFTIDGEQKSINVYMYW